MSSTPLSNLIQSFHETGYREDFEAMFSLFLKSQIGIHAVNVPQEYQGQTVITKDESVGLANTTHGDGMKRLLAFADPQEFNKRFGPKCNGEMSAKELLKAALHNSDCQGVLLNSACSEISAIISRSLIESVLDGASHQVEPKPERINSSSDQRRWWQVWK